MPAPTHSHLESADVPERHTHRHHDHDHAHEHGHPADRDHHENAHGPLGRLRHALTLHSHDAADSIDSALESSARGIRAVKLSLVGLGVTAALQGAIVAISGSVALLADTIHNFSDALTAVPLWIAFVLGRRPPNRRYTYGYGRAEDLAGLFVIAMIALSAVLAGYEAITRLLDPAPVTNLGWVAAAGLVGFLGNEAVAVFRIREGKAIGSAALVADGHHARTDGLTSLAVLLGAGGVALGWTWADPAIGLLITVAILMVLRTAGRDVFARLMDAVDPELTDRAEDVVVGTPGVAAVTKFKLRWIGHHLHAEGTLVLRPGTEAAGGAAIAAEAGRRLRSAVTGLATLTLATATGEPPGAARPGEGSAA
jgi:cation diffusion facilitator family transporter